MALLQEAPRIKTLEEVTRWKPPEESVVVAGVRAKIIALARNIVAQIADETEETDESLQRVIIPRAYIGENTNNKYVDIPGRAASGTIAFPALFEDDLDEEYDAVRQAVEAIIGPSEMARGNSLTDDIFRRSIFQVLLSGTTSDACAIDIGRLESINGMTIASREILYRLLSKRDLQGFSQRMEEYGVISWGTNSIGVADIVPHKLGVASDSYLFSIPDVGQGPNLPQIIAVIKERTSMQNSAS